MSENVGYYYIALETMGKLKPLNELKCENDEYGENFQEKLQELVSGFDKELNIIWFDLAQFFSNEYKQFFLNQTDIDGKYRPCIFIGSQSVETLQESNFLHHKKISQLDNNIWTYYINIQEKDAFDREFKNIIDAISLNYSNNLYSSAVGIEYLEFFIRMCSSNYLEGGHSSQVLPFVYTPKTLIKTFIDKIVKQIKDKDKLELKVLLIDDYGNKNLRIEKVSESDEKNTDDEDVKKTNTGIKKYISDDNNQYSKASHLLKIWEAYKNKLNIKLCLDILESPDIESLKEKKCYYDIYLIDYNLNEDINGVDFLKEIIDDKNLTDLGPFGIPWIIPISSFSNAFIDEMRNKEIHFTDEQYILSRGADFINTPFLFLYYFITFISQQIEKFSMVMKNISKIDEVVNILDKMRQEEINKGRIILDERESEGIEFDALFREHIKNRQNIDYILELNKNIQQEDNNKKGSLLYSLCSNLDLKKTEHRINFYEQLLYNLAYRNYEGNEEIIIFHDLLKKQ